MIDYRQVYSKFLEYSANPSQANYNELWVVCWQRMKALCLSRYGAGSDPEDIDDILNNATLRVLAKITTAADVNVDFISKTFYWSIKQSASNLFTVKGRRAEIMRKYISDIEKAAKIYFDK